MPDDFIMEKRLKELDPELHRRFTDTVFVMHNTLAKFKRLFPEYTDHSVYHSLNVQEFCNKLIGPDQIDMLSAHELYVLLMACYLHDSGMAISESDYEEFKDELGVEEYFRISPEDEVCDFVREKHNEFSGKFITKYADMLEIPSPELLFAIVQVARGHRRTNLFDDKEYPVALDTGGGNTVCTPYLAALIRLADEVDVTTDRNPKLLYDIESMTDEREIPHARMLEAVPSMDVTSRGFMMNVHTDDEVLFAGIEQKARKMQDTLDLCRGATNKRTKFKISQRWVRIKRI
jgi:hypothetical protein